MFLLAVTQFLPTICLVQILLHGTFVKPSYVFKHFTISLFMGAYTPLGGAFSEPQNSVPQLHSCQSSNSTLTAFGQESLPLARISFPATYLLDGTSQAHGSSFLLTIHVWAVYFSPPSALLLGFRMISGCFYKHYTETAWSTQQTHCCCFS